MRDTIDMAREAGLEEMWELTPRFTARLKAFESLVRADERTRLHPKKIKAAKDEYCHGDERYYAND
jgi:hypothetical protein